MDGSDPAAHAGRAHGDEPDVEIVAGGQRPSHGDAADLRVMHAIYADVHK